MKNLFPILILLILSCTFPGDRNKLETELLKAENEFIKTAEARGKIYAYYHFLAEDGLVLPEFGQPLDRTAYDRYLEQFPDQNIAGGTSWNPQKSFIDISGRIGFVSGIFTSGSANENGTILREGHYIRIWRLQKGKWELITDAGNEKMELYNKKSVHGG